VLQGIGDDCARVRVRAGHELVVTTDLLLEGRHFRRGAEPRALGHKALAVNLSDLAAGGATPRWFILALALPSVDQHWLREFSKGLFALARREGVDLIGGDTTRGPLAIDITALGEAPAGQAHSRSGARPGHDLWVSGELGGAALALRRPRLRAVAKRLHRPEPRVALGQALRGIASACIDVSDGLAGDLGHILERSRVGARVEYEQIPKPNVFEKFGKLERQCVLSGGDDYELLFTAPRAARTKIASLSKRLRIRLSRIGSITRGRKLLVLDGAGRPMKIGGGFDHFA
jgi:thiamine-monophosphate kinase